MRDIDELLRSDGAEWRASQPPSVVNLDPAGFPASARSRVELNRFVAGTAGLVGALGLALVLAVVWLQRPTPPNIGQPTLPLSSGTPTSTTAAECYRGEYRVVPTPDHQVTADDLSTILSIIEHRIDSLGVVGVTIHTQGTDRIVVQLPCISDTQDVRELISTTGRLDFVPIPRSMTGVGQGTTLGTSLPACPDNLANLANPCVLFSGDQIASASPGVDATGERVVNFTLKSAAATLFDKFAAVAFAGYNGAGNEQFAIVLDGTVVSAPSVNAPSFGGQGQIGGTLAAAEVNYLVTVLRYGALPLSLEEISFTRTSPSSPPSASPASSATATDLVTKCLDIDQATCDKALKAVLATVAPSGWTPTHVWLDSGLLAPMQGLLFDPGANFPYPIPPDNGQWIGSAEVAFAETDQHAGMNLAAVGSDIVAELTGYAVPQRDWCSGYCPSSSAADGQFSLELVLPHLDWKADEPIVHGMAILSLSGSAVTTISGSGDSLINFAYAEVGGTRRFGSLANCRLHGLSARSGDTDQPGPIEASDGLGPGSEPGLPAIVHRRPRCALAGGNLGHHGTHHLL